MNTQKEYIKIVADSACDIQAFDDVAYAVAPLKVSTAEREFVDDGKTDASEMVEYLSRYKGKSQSSCPNIADWINAFGDADNIVCVTITSGLSGSYNSACTAKQMYEAENPGRRVFVLDSLSAGPEMTLIVEKLRELVLSGLDFDSVCREITAYHKTTRIVFMQKSLHNFANNGRVSHAVALMAGLAGICVVAKASDDGKIEPIDKCRGEARSFAKIMEHLDKMGYVGGRMCISQCFAEKSAEAFSRLVKEKYDTADVKIISCGILCSFYAERGGLLIGFEGSGDK